MSSDLPADTGAVDGLDPFEVFTGDRAAAARLRASLTQISVDHAGTEVGAVADQVLAGRRPIRDLADDPSFSMIIEAGMDDYRRFLDSLTPAERADMVENASKAAQAQ